MFKSRHSSLWNTWSVTMPTQVQTTNLDISFTQLSMSIPLLFLGFLLHPIFAVLIHTFKTCQFLTVQL